MTSPHRYLAVSCYDDVIFNAFLANVPILYSLKIAEIQRFPGIFREYKMGTLVGNGLIFFVLLQLPLGKLAQCHHLHIALCYCWHYCK